MAKSSFVPPPNTSVGTGAALGDGGSTNLHVVGTINSNDGSAVKPDLFYQFQQQSAKGLDARLRFSMSVQSGGKPYTFKAHLDPNHLQYEQNKRLVEIDALNGIVIQDFGYKPATLLLKGTTGSAYYKELSRLDLIFRHQSVNGIPTTVSITIEQRSYNVVWKQFGYERQISASGGNLYNYSMSFVIMSDKYGDFNNGSVSDYTYGALIPRINAMNVSALYGAGAVVQNVPAPGLSPRVFLQSLPGVPNSQLLNALAYVQGAWNPTLNNNAPYPGDNIPLTATQLITIPGDWTTVQGLYTFNQATTTDKFVGSISSKSGG